MRIKLLFIALFTLSLTSYLITPFVINKFGIFNIEEPIFGQYSNDELSFLKTFYLIDQGNSYYPAFKIAREGLSTPNYLTSDTFLWRMPTVFYLWNIFANSGQQILTIFLFLSICLIEASFFLVKRFTNKFIAAMSPVLLFPYILDTLRYKTAFLFTEWWALFFYIFGLTAFVYRRSYLAMFFLTTAGFIRELFVLPIMLMFLFSFKDKDNRRTFLFPIIFFAFFYLIHMINISQVMEMEGKSNTLQRIHQFSLENLQRMVSFSMRNFVFYGLKTHLLLFLFSVLSVTMTLLFSKIKELKVIILPVVLFILFLPMISVYDNDYWGILFMPILLILSPLALNFIRIKR